MSRRKAPSSLTSGLGLGNNSAERIQDPLNFQNDMEGADVDDADDDSPSTTLLALRVKSSNPEAHIHVPPTMTISDVKDVVRKKALGWAESQDRYLRLICKGRLLAPDTALLEEFHVRTGDVVHAVLAKAGVRGGQQAALQRGLTTATTVLLPPESGAGRNAIASEPTPAPPTMTRRYRGTMIGPGGRVLRAPDDEDDGDDDDVEVEDNENYSDSDDPNDLEHGRHRGLDRLRVTHRLSRQEVRALRTYFSRQLERHGQAMREAVGTDVENQNSPPPPRWRVEDEWMAAQGPLSEFRLNVTPRNGWGRTRFLSAAASASATPRAVPGTDRDFLWGFTLGFIVGFVMLIWVWMPTVPHKQKLGILTGISVRLAVEVLSGDDENSGDKRKDGDRTSEGDDYGYELFDLPGQGQQ